MFNQLTHTLLVDMGCISCLFTKCTYTPLHIYSVHTKQLLHARFLATLYNSLLNIGQQN